MMRQKANIRNLEYICQKKLCKSLTEKWTKSDFANEFLKFEGHKIDSTITTR